jgi:hypothetical protein
MLSRVSWGQFGVLLLGAAIVYYAYVLMTFYRKEMKDFLSGKRRPGVPPGKVVAKTPADQTTLFVADQPGADHTPEMFKVMEAVISQLKSVVSMGVAYRSGEEELKDRIREVLAKFGHLKRTAYQVAVNNYLVRVCSSNFSMVLDEDGLEKLWG